MRSCQYIRPRIMHTDHRYIEALRRNDSRLVREIYVQHATSARRWVEQRGGSADDAQDVFQEAVLAVYDKAADPNFTLTCPLGALLHIIYSRKWVDRLRLKNRETGVRNQEEIRYNLEVTDDALSIAESVLAEEQQQQRLARTFIQLSDLCQRLFTLLSNGTSSQDAAEQLQMNSVNTLFRRKNACAERWRALMAGV